MEDMEGTHLKHQGENFIWGPIFGGENIQQGIPGGSFQGHQPLYHSPK